MSFSSGQTLTAAGLDAALMAVTPPNAPLLSGTGTTFGAVAIGANLTLSVAGTLSATGVITNAGLGLADSAGTVSLGTIAAGSLMGNAGSVAAVPGAVAVGANLTLSVAGTLSATGVITAAASGLTANAGTVSLGTLASAGLLGGELGAAPGVITLGTKFQLRWQHVERGWQQWWIQCGWRRPDEQRQHGQPRPVEPLRVRNQRRHAQRDWDDPQHRAEPDIPVCIGLEHHRHHHARR